MTEAEEVFKSIPGYEGLYSASNLGRIRRETNNYGKKCTIFIKPYLWTYYGVTLCKKSIRKYYGVHRLVAMAFLGKVDPKKLHVNHKDLNKTNNNLSNLEYLTCKENHIHAKMNGVQIGEKCSTAKLKEKDIIKIRELYKNGTKAKELAKIYNIHTSNIYYIVNKKTWKHI